MHTLSSLFLSRSVSVLHVEVHDGHEELHTCHACLGVSGRIPALVLIAEDEPAKLLQRFCVCIRSNTVAFEQTPRPI